MQQTIKKVETNKMSPPQVITVGKLSMRLATPDESSKREAIEILEGKTYGFFEILPDTNIIDVGACCGAYTLYALSRGANVIAIEPEPNNARTLQLNTVFNGFHGKVNIIRIALGDSDGYTTLHTSKCSLAHSTKYVPERKESNIQVIQRRLDNINTPLKIDILKIDVEGSEIQVLNGSKTTFRKTNRVIIEVHSPQVSPEEVKILLEQQGFVLVKKSTRYAQKTEYRPKPPKNMSWSIMFFVRPESENVK